MELEVLRKDMMKVSLPVQNLLIFLLFMSIVATLLVCWEMAEC